MRGEQSCYSHWSKFLPVDRQKIFPPKTYLMQSDGTFGPRGVTNFYEVIYTPCSQKNCCSILCVDDLKRWCIGAFLSSPSSFRGPLCLLLSPISSFSKEGRSPLSAFLCSLIFRSRHLKFDCVALQPLFIHSITSTQSARISSEHNIQVTTFRAKQTPP